MYKIEDGTLRTIELRKETHPDVKFEIFERLNVGSVKLKDQELRNCVYRGEYNDLIKDLAENNEDFKQILNTREPQKRMQDRELVLHFLAFYNQTYLKYKPPMKRFLNEEMEENRNITSKKMIELEQTFKDSVSLTKTIFGDKAFRRFTAGNEKTPNGKWEKPVNIGLFEVIMVGFTRYKKNQIKEYSDILRDELIYLMTCNNEFINSISGTGTTATDKVRQRFKIWDWTLEKIVGMPKTEPRFFEYELKEQIYYQNPNEKPKCDICGNRIMLIEDAAIDHKIPYIEGGKTNINNASLTHRYCNLKKGKRSSA
jgi:5-methylcytosine-specific restriction endonuclease McrA